MLKPAVQYKEKLAICMANIWFNDKYKYYVAEPYCEIPETHTSSWCQNEFVSVDNNDNILGFIDYNINRRTYNASGLCILSFTDKPTLTFGKDILQSIDDIFQKFNFNKLRFSVVVGNPIEKTYDKLIVKYGGCIAGYSKKDIQLWDGQLYDLKTYEIMREDYLRCKKNMSKQ